MFYKEFNIQKNSQLKLELYIILNNLGLNGV